MSAAERERIDQLTALLQKADEAYYTLADPIMGDGEYDGLYRELRALEARFPQYVHADSPTRRIGERLEGGSRAFVHSVPMLSLGNTYEQAELEDFLRKVRRDSGDHVRFTVEPKIDGVAVSLHYRDGVFSVAATRGDGLQGEEISHNIRTIRSLPLEIPAAGAMEIRGEVYIPHQAFERINQQRLEQGESLYANPRNLAAGSLKLLDPAQSSRRGLQIFCYSLQGFPHDSHFQCLQTLRDWGFPVSDLVRQCASDAEVWDAVQHIRQQRELLPFDIDGAVIKVDQLHLHEELGTTAKIPRYAIAYKYEAQQVSTRLRDITFQVGRTGVITPVAELDPVLLAGSTISRATLHNFEELRRKDIRIGDQVLIEKGGDVIPKVVKPIMALRSADASEVVPPENCPECGSPLHWSDNGVHLYCQNPLCPAQRLGALLHFVSRDAMDIAGMGEKVVQRFLDEGILTDIPDIYHLVYERVASLDGFGVKSALNLQASVEASKAHPLERVLFALGIRHVGKKTAQLLARHFGSMERLMQASIEELTAVEEVGEIVARSIYSFLREPASVALVDALKRSGLNMESSAPRAQVASGLSGRSVVFTGKLSRPRKEYEEMAQLGGARVLSGVSGSLDYLVCGEDAGSKLDKARKLGVAIIDEEEFVRLCSAE
ncbi:NAD-dependent DNA ligase LigA [Desulfurispirillum indicum]|uniref:NAD-dependent DNA ligase LigA n=1 Tax=Desulfurispirillum indicum TaxID=936456 RepID=UPI001CFBFD6F|nr:NAD-dependent DNA ligase LigA [Desulfurispirillum indicum]UCZ57509.1 NAD-dependent DNA ligase LigA [Desulfurispirillum indicum]